MADVHAQRDLRLPAVAAEVPLADEQADDDALVALVHASGSVQRARPTCFTGETRRQRRRGDDEVPVGLVALGVRLDVVAVLEVLVHDLALGRAHGVQRHRPAGAAARVGGLVGLAVQHLLAALAVARGVDGHPHGLVAAGVAVGDLEREVLDGVDRLAVAADEQAQVVALERAADAARRRPR